jgi:hypothetical protein
VAPLCLRGAQGEEEYPWRWLGGTGEVSSVGKRDLHGVNVWEDIFASSSSVKVCLLKLLLVIKFNLHLFILLYSDDDFIAMRFPFEFW